MTRATSSGEGETLDRLDDIFEQFRRYGGGPRKRILDVLEKLTDVNDDIEHMRDPDLIRAGIAEAKALMDGLAEDL